VGAADNGYVWIVLLVTMASALIGFYDDYAKVTKQNPRASRRGCASFAGTGDRGAGLVYSRQVASGGR
jgi:UDP-N-acetylmuramyl pentapeptide phosphotransferase/UDP-N-acetylglucosamine-1-phosphate transferase